MRVLLYTGAQLQLIRMPLIIIRNRQDMFNFECFNKIMNFYSLILCLLFRCEYVEISMI